jgi:hypothetical protein
MQSQLEVIDGSCKGQINSIASGDVEKAPKETLLHIEKQGSWQSVRTRTLQVEKLCPLSHVS